MSEFTQWFDMEKLPHREGVYQLRNRRNHWFYGKFKKGRWHMLSRSITDADRQRSKSISCYNGEMAGWRGLSPSSDAGETR